MARIPDTTVSEAVGKTADPLDELVPDYTPLLRRIGDARFSLLGEASHGTHEFYRDRARITKRLIEEHDVLAFAIEGDWPDAARVNRYVRGAGDDAHADDALADFRRFPAWMWRNTEVVEFVEWLRLHNEALPPDAPRVGFYGLDLYSLRAAAPRCAGAATTRRCRRTPRGSGSTASISTASARRWRPCSG